MVYNIIREGMKSWWNKMWEWLKSAFFNKELEISIVGLQNAGKSTLVNSLATGAFEEDTIPTIGFNHRELKKGKISMKIWDLGGQTRFRESWEKYCRDADVIIFVADSNDRSNIDIARASLHELLTNQSLRGIPLLVLANKNDIEGALSEQQTIAKLNLTDIKDRKVVCYSVSAKSQNRLDVALKWLSELQPKKK